MLIGLRNVCDVIWICVAGSQSHETKDIQKEIIGLKTLVKQGIKATDKHFKATDEQFKAVKKGIEAVALQGIGNVSKYSQNKPTNGATNNKK